MSQNSVCSPFRKSDLTDQLRLDPTDRSVGYRSILKRAIFLDQRLQLRSNFRKVSFVESTACVANVNELIPLVHTQQEGAKIFPPTTGLGKAANDCFLAQVSFHLKPISASLPLLIGTPCVLGNDPFKTSLGNQIEKSDTMLLDMIT